MFGVGSPPKEAGATPGQKKANSEAARKFLEKEKSDSVDGTTRKKKIRDKETAVRSCPLEVESFHATSQRMLCRITLNLPTLSLSEMIEHKRKTSMEDKRKSSKEEPTGRKLSTEHRKQSKEEKN